MQSNLRSNNSFSIQQTVVGEVPIYYGKVYINSTRTTRNIDGGKYRTSCYMSVGPVDVLIRNVNDKTDRYYALEEPVEIVEYDESGKPFQIAHMEPLTLLDLSFDESKKMRERYWANNSRTLTDKEIAYIYNNWVSPVNWK